MPRWRKVVFLNNFVIYQGLITKSGVRNDRSKWTDEHARTRKTCCKRLQVIVARNRRMLTPRSRNRASEFHRFWTNSLHGSTALYFEVETRMIGCVVDVLDPGPPPLPDTAFLRRRPATVGRDAPLIERGSEGPACDDIRLASCVQRSSR